jgi:hypothetical protein
MHPGEITAAPRVDQNELRVNAILTITVLVAAFVLNRWELVAFQAAALFLTALHTGFGPYVIFYHLVLRQAGIVRPDLRPDNRAPHRLAAMIGTIVAATASCLLATGRSVAGWGLVWLLISLAAAGLAGWCAGCFIYYQMNRLGFRGLFRHAPVKGVFPGARPPKA